MPSRVLWLSYPGWEQSYLEAQVSNLPVAANNWISFAKLAELCIQLLPFAPDDLGRVMIVLVSLGTMYGGSSVPTTVM